MKSIHNNDNNDDKVLLVVTCSSTSLLDEAVLRAGRLDVYVTLPLPSVDDLIDIMLVMLRESNVPHVLDRWDMKGIAERMVKIKGTASLCAGVLNKSRYSLMRELVQMKKQQEEQQEQQKQQHQQYEEGASVRQPVLEIRHLLEALSLFSPSSLSPLSSP